MPSATTHASTREAKSPIISTSATLASSVATPWTMARSSLRIEGRNSRICWSPEYPAPASSTAMSAPLARTALMEGSRSTHSHDECSVISSTKPREVRLRVEHVANLGVAQGIGLDVDGEEAVLGQVGAPRERNAEHDRLEIRLDSPLARPCEPHVGAHSAGIGVGEAGESLVADDHALVEVDDRLVVALHPDARNRVVEELRPPGIGGVAVSVNCHERLPKSRRSRRHRMADARHRARVVRLCARDGRGAMRHQPCRNLRVHALSIDRRTRVSTFFAAYVHRPQASHRAAVTSDHRRHSVDISRVPCGHSHN